MTFVALAFRRSDATYRLSSGWLEIPLPEGVPRDAFTCVARLDPDLAQVKRAKAVGAGAIEINTGRYAEATGAAIAPELRRIEEAARAGAAEGLEVLAGHGLNYVNVIAIAAIPPGTIDADFPDEWMVIVRRPFILQSSFCIQHSLEVSLVLTLLVLQGPDKGRRFELPDATTLVGRESRQLPLTDNTVSRRHCELVYNETGDWVLIHVGFALSKVDEEEALATHKLLEQMGAEYEQELEELKASVIE